MIIYALIERAAQRGRNSLFPVRLEISVSPVSVPQNWLSGNLPTPLHSDEKLAIPKFGTLLSNKKRFVTLELGPATRENSQVCLPSSLLYPTVCVKWDKATSIQCGSSIINKIKSRDGLLRSQCWRHKIVCEVSRTIRIIALKATSSKNKEAEPRPGHTRSRK